MPSQLAAPRSSYTKLIAMVLFLLIDLGLNSILDYDLFNNQTTVNGNSNLLLGLLGLQTVVEISTFLILFIAMADTFLFRVGLLGLLMKTFRTVLLFHPLYIAITIASGSLRVRHLAVEGNSLSSLYRYDTYTRMSMVQKIGKPIPLHDVMMQTIVYSEMFFYFALTPWSYVIDFSNGSSSHLISRSCDTLLPTQFTSNYKARSSGLLQQTCLGLSYKAGPFH